MARQIEIRYKCRCLPREVSFHMRERLSHEPIEDFMKHVQLAISVDHNNRSPLCLARALEYAKLPAEGDGIGTTKGGLS